MATKTNIQYYVDYIRTMLGADFVEVEVEEIFEKIVKQSLEELKEYLTMNKIVTIPYAQAIDMAKLGFKVKHVNRVMRVQSADSIQNSAGAYGDAFLLSLGMIQGVPYDLSRLTELMQIRRIKSLITVDLDFVWDDPILHVYQTAMATPAITVEFTPEVSKVSEITEDYWIGKLKKLALANTKIILGRVRGKYKLSGSLYENDAATLLAEGNAEKKELMDMLKSNHDIIFPIQG